MASPLAHPEGDVCVCRSVLGWWKQPKPVPPRSWSLEPLEEGTRRARLPGAGVGSPFLEVVSWRPICQGFWVRVDWVIVTCGGEDCD